jgi:hypothetical protein
MKQMHAPELPRATGAQSRRHFLGSSAGLLSATWISANWSSLASAAEHPAHEGSPATVDTTTSPTPSVFTVAEAADVEAITNQIVPGGATPGAREARVIQFIDRALGSVLAVQLPAFRSGLSDFQHTFAAHDSAGRSFSQVSEARQLDWLHEIEGTAFFQSVRQLTVLGLVANPRYGGNYQKAGWKLLGFDDRHVWQPPFGHYDAGYAGFEPYPGTKLWVAGPEMKG